MIVAQELPQGCGTIDDVTRSRSDELVAIAKTPGDRDRDHAGGDRCLHVGCGIADQSATSRLDPEQLGQRQSRCRIWLPRNPGAITNHPDELDLGKESGHHLPGRETRTLRTPTKSIV